MKKRIDLELASIARRRSFLQVAAGAGAATLGAGLLAACGGGGDEAISSTREDAQTRVINGCSSKAGAIRDAAGNVVGFIDAINDSSNASVIVLSPVGCDLREMKLWVGTDLSLLPTSGGVPNYSQFPLQYSASGATAQHEFVVSLASMGITSANLVCGKTPPTYFVVGQVTTTCGSGTVIGYTAPNSTGSYSYAAFELCCYDTPVVLTGCETAFAKGGYVFATDGRANPESLPSLSLTRNRWGWAINLMSAGTTTYPIYAGAGMNRTSAGKQVGTLTISYTGTQATVTYALAAGVTMTEAHLYAGDTKPTTIAPGQYGNIAYFATPASSHSLTVPLVDTGSDGVWLIAHAVVC